MKKTMHVENCVLKIIEFFEDFAIYMWNGDYSGWGFTFERYCTSLREFTILGVCAIFLCEALFKDTSRNIANMYRNANTYGSL